MKFAPCSSVHCPGQLNGPAGSHRDLENEGAICLHFPRRFFHSPPCCSAHRVHCKHPIVSHTSPLHQTEEKNFFAFMRRSRKMRVHQPHRVFLCSKRRCVANHDEALTWCRKNAAHEPTSVNSATQTSLRNCQPEVKSGNYLMRQKGPDSQVGRVATRWRGAEPESCVAHKHVCFHLQIVTFTEL